MASLTDPARELAEIAEKLTQSASQSGESFLSQQFEVEPWSTDFVKIIACIMERADLVGSVVERSTMMDDDHKASALKDLAQFKSGFTGLSLIQPWNAAQYGLSKMKDHGRLLQYLSRTVREEVVYPKLSDEEIQEFLLLIDAYLGELAASDEGPEFVRRAITDGLSTFRFNLAKIGWTGAGYVLSAFRETVFIYEASKQPYATSSDLDPEAALRSLGSILSKFKKTVETAKGWTDTGQTVWKWYQIGTTVVAPLLLTSKALGAN